VSGRTERVGQRLQVARRRWRRWHRTDDYRDFSRHMEWWWAARRRANLELNGRPRPTYRAGGN